MVMNFLRIGRGWHCGHKSLANLGAQQMYLISSSFGKKIGSKKTALRASAATALICVGLLLATSSASLADESGTSFWLPGQFGSLAAVPGTPGWSLGAVYYHTTVSAGGSVAAAKEIQIGRFPPTVNVSLNANLNAQADLLLLAPTY